MYTKAEKLEALEALKSILKRGDTITAICRDHNSRSGTTKWDFYLFKRNGERRFLTYNMARVLEYRTDKFGSIIAPYINMDPAFEAVYRLGFKLFKDRTVKCEPCGRCNHTGKRVESAGYALTKENL